MEQYSGIRALFLGALLMSGISSSAAVAEEVESSPASENYQLKFERAKDSRARLAPEPWRRIRFGVSASAKFIDWEAAWGGGAFVLAPISSYIFLGLDTGYYRWSLKNYFFSQSVSLIPILGTILFRVDTGHSSFSPFIGMSMGPTVMRIESSGYYGGESSATLTKFEFLGRLGAAVGEGQHFMAELRAGALMGTFVFMPTVSYIF